MDKAINRQESESCIGGRLWRVARTASLLMGVGFSGVLMVDLPTPFSPQANSHAIAQSYVPASDKWITPGATPSDLRGQNGVSAVDPIAAPMIERQQTRQRRRPRGIQLASLGRETMRADRVGPSLAGRGVRWNASSACLNSTLRGVIGQVAASFGPVTVNSTCRSPQHNARVGGARHSHHLTGNAADFRINGNPQAVLAFLSSHRSVGGVKHYGGGIFHIDNGPRRSW